MLEICWYNVKVKGKGAHPMKKCIALLLALLVFSLPTLALAATGIVFSAPHKPTAVFGEDDRVTITDPKAYPYSAIGNLYAVGECGHRWQGSCFMIGPDVMITAAHCLRCFHEDCIDRYVPIKKADIYFGYKSQSDCLYHYNGGIEYWTGTDFRTSGGGYDYVEENIIWDYAYLKLKEPVGNYTGYFGMMTPMDSDYDDYGFYKDECIVAGYRDDILKADIGPVFCDGGVLLNYWMDDEAGNSGGPLFTPDCFAIGIIIAENSYENTARRLTPEIRDNMRKNLK